MRQVVEFLGNQSTMSLDRYHELTRKLKPIATVQRFMIVLAQRGCPGLNPDLLDPEDSTDIKHLKAQGLIMANGLTDPNVVQYLMSTGWIAGAPILHAPVIVHTVEERELAHVQV